MCYCDNCNVDSVNRCVRGMGDFGQIHKAQDSKWDGSEPCQYTIHRLERFLYVMLGVNDSMATRFFALES